MLLHAKLKLKLKTYETLNLYQLLRRYSILFNLNQNHATLNLLLNTAKTYF